MSLSLFFPFFFFFLLLFIKYEELLFVFSSVTLHLKNINKITLCSDVFSLSLVPLGIDIIIASA